MLGWYILWSTVFSIIHSYVKLPHNDMNAVFVKENKLDDGNWLFKVCLAADTESMIYVINWYW